MWQTTWANAFHNPAAHSSIVPEVLPDARYAISLATTGAIPRKWLMMNFSAGRSAASSAANRLKVRSSTVSGSVLSCAGGISYSIPDSTCRFSLVVKSMLLSTPMILSFTSVMMMLENLPIISAMMCFLVGKPRSSWVSKVILAARSKPSCSMADTRAPVKCFRSIIQNMGGTAGFSTL